MPERRILVTNATPLIALIAATGSLDVLRQLYERVVVPFEVCQEMAAGGVKQFGVQEFAKDMWMEKRSQPISIPLFLQNSLDSGEPEFDSLLQAVDLKK